MFLKIRKVSFVALGFVPLGWDSESMECGPTFRCIGPKPQVTHLKGTNLTSLTGWISAGG